MYRLAVFFVLPWLAWPSDAAAQICATTPIAVQVLGSGGPGVYRDRAGASYVLWVGGQSRMLVDMGGGAFSRFGQAQVDFGALALVALSHLHPDHVSDLPALLWSSRNMMRRDPLPIVGPSGNATAPDIGTFLHRLFDERDGAFQVLGSVMGSSADAAQTLRLDARTVDATKTDPSVVFDGDDLAVTALGIPHDSISTLAYRVRVRDRTVVFSSDQTGTNPRFIDFAKGADVLLMHMAVGVGQGSAFHAAPAVVGRVAQQAGVKRLVVSHIGAFDLDAAVTDLRSAYAGPLTVGTDLLCIPVP